MYSTECLVDNFLQRTMKTYRVIIRLCSSQYCSKIKKKIIFFPNNESAMLSSKPAEASTHLELPEFFEHPQMHP